MGGLCRIGYHQHCIGVRYEYGPRLLRVGSGRNSWEVAHSMLVCFTSLCIVYSVAI